MNVEILVNIISDRCISPLEISRIALSIYILSFKESSSVDRYAFSIVENAFETIEMAYLTSDDSTKDRIYIDKAIMLISIGELQKSEIILTKIATFTKYDKIKRESYYWLGLGNLYSYKWSAAKNNMKKYYGESHRQYIDSIFSDADKLDFKSPIRARVLSLFVPGLGQIYSKDYKNGFNSLIINSITSYFLLNSIINKNYFESLIIYFTAFERYYQGSRSNAELIANNYNQKISKQFAESVFNSILKIQD